ncbi:lipopolysaccharide transport periplasmic protein LptA [Bordetella sp. J329]|jgi:lipopolysaccharide export system protein LptA|uniref:lipopolysaccharide transport periplasmic protein LptA n=1 Tax=Kerstersia gyiorum TaxID=206506 RepID=UPI000FDA73D6|nr:lipopolysaccharide transport periplasmic protein LptA [Kerstersia gyiorum]AZV92520.1 lipopolysaccharide transport periplasmic protein LptA [Bordetella sp. J329]MCH4272996.1 lipopolysaccharide transport periplasmic protein LptA [Kerstersia gyiorum]MCI1229259.1 lipopolysaccharide transport periplasmic protein LptA [Kerstersia gyiorum]
MTPFFLARPILLLSACAALLCGTAQAQQADAADPSTQILSVSLEYDDLNRSSIFTGDVIMTRGMMTLNADRLEMREDKDGFQYGTATANTGKQVRIRQERPENAEIFEARGQRADYDSKAETIVLSGNASIVRMICGKPYDRIHGDRIVYNQKNDTYSASSESGRVRSVAQPRNKTEAAAAECLGRPAAKQE